MKILGHESHLPSVLHLNHFLTSLCKLVVLNPFVYLLELHSFFQSNSRSGINVQARHIIDYTMKDVRRFHWDVSTYIAQRNPWSLDLRIRSRSVVFPLPKNPDNNVTGNLSSWTLFSVMFCSVLGFLVITWVADMFLRRQLNVLLEDCECPPQIPQISLADCSSTQS